MTLDQYIAMAVVVLYLAGGIRSLRWYRKTFIESPILGPWHEWIWDGKNYRWRLFIIFCWWPFRVLHKFFG